MTALSAEKVRALFAQEAEVRLAQLSQLLLQLEQTGGDDTLIRSIFREIHTIKGSSAVAGLDEVSSCAHQFEELVDELRSGQGAPTPDVIDTLLARADRLGEVIAASLVTDRPVASTAPEHPTADVGAALPGHPDHRSNDPLPVPAQRPRSAGPSSSTGASGVIMVPTERLEALIRLVGESASAHLRVGRMLKDRFKVDPATCSEFTELSRSLNDLQDRAMRTQMVPVSTITDQLHRAVRDLSRAQGKEKTSGGMHEGSTPNWTVGCCISWPIRCCTWSATRWIMASSPWPNARPPESNGRGRSGCTPCSWGPR